MIIQNTLLIALAVTVRQRRSELKMTREELAEAMGVPLQTVVDIEESNITEGSSSKSTLKLLSRALRLSDSALCAYIDKQQKGEIVREVPKEVRQVPRSPANERELPVQSEKPSGKPLILPPMFSRGGSSGEVVAKPEDGDQLKAYAGLPALPANLTNAPKPRSPRIKITNPVGGTSLPKSPFIPRHAVQKVQPIHLSPGKSLLESWILNPPTPKSFIQLDDSKTETPIEPLPSLAVLMDPPVAADPQAPERQALPQSTPETRINYVPRLANGLSVVELQKETGIFRIHNAPDPAPNQKVKDDFGDSVLGMTPSSTPVEKAASKKPKEAKK